MHMKKKRAQIIMKSCNRRDLEIEQVKKYLEGNGYELSSNVESRQFETLADGKVDPQADLIILSTCAFSSVTEESSLHDLLLIQQKKKNTAEVIVCGCLPEINPDRLKAMFNGASFGPRGYDQLDTILKAGTRFQDYRHGNRATSYAEDVFTIQIEQGCPCNCSYCAIKHSIGSLVSLPLEEAVSQFKKGLDEGYKKFVLMGDCSGGYGLDIGESLGSLLERISEFEGNYTVSLTDIASFHLQHCYENIKDMCAKKRMPSLYVAVQSANSRILGLMKRQCNMVIVREMLLELKKLHPHIELVTSIIAGFPSETIEEFEETIEFCNSIGFDTIYCHGYSPRPNIASEYLPGKLSAEEIEKRCLMAKARLGSKIALVTIPGKGGEDVRKLGKLSRFVARYRHQLNHLLWNLKLFNSKK